MKVNIPAFIIIISTNCHPSQHIFSSYKSIIFYLSPHDMPIKNITKFYKQTYSYVLVYFYFPFFHPYLKSFVLFSIMKV